jgi:hypothetical protein
VAIDDQIGTPAAWQAHDPAALTARRQYVTSLGITRPGTC